MGHLPVDGVAVDKNRVSILVGSLVKAFQQNEHARCLQVLQARIEAHNNVVKQDVDVGHLMRVERSYHLV